MSNVPTIPNANMPLVQGASPESLISVPWQRQFALLFDAATITNMIMIYVGAAAPKGWTQDVTVGLPALPPGMIWIRKD